MTELLCHLVGDYVLQNHWMATRKTQAWGPALVHATLYTTPFLLLTQAWPALLIILGTHAVIDRYRVAGWWVRFYGVGVPGWLPPRLGMRAAEPAPPFLGVWLTIIADNTLHMVINHLALGIQ